MHEQRESKRKEVLEALIRDLPCSEADVMRLLQVRWLPLIATDCHGLPWTATDCH
jgi:hypothetical protein